MKGGYYPGSGCQEMLNWFMEEAYGGEWCSTKVDQVKSFTVQVNMMMLIDVFVVSLVHSHWSMNVEALLSLVGS